MHQTSINDDNLLVNFDMLMTPCVQKLNIEPQLPTILTESAQEEEESFESDGAHTPPSMFSIEIELNAEMQTRELNLETEFDDNESVVPLSRQRHFSNWGSEPRQVELLRLNSIDAFKIKNTPPHVDSDEHLRRTNIMTSRAPKCKM